MHMVYEHFIVLLPYSPYVITPPCFYVRYQTEVGIPLYNFIFDLFINPTHYLRTTRDTCVHFFFFWDKRHPSPNCKGDIFTFYKRIDCSKWLTITKHRAKWTTSVFWLISEWKIWNTQSQVFRTRHLVLGSHWIVTSWAIFVNLPWSELPWYVYPKLKRTRD
jgi:hypothetical protein